MTPFKGQGANQALLTTYYLLLRTTYYNSLLATNCQALSDSALLARHVADALLADSAAEEGVAAAACAHAAHGANGTNTDGAAGAAGAAGAVVGKVVVRKETRVPTALA